MSAYQSAERWNAEECASYSLDLFNMEKLTNILDEDLFTISNHCSPGDTPHIPANKASLACVWTEDFLRASQGPSSPPSQGPSSPPSQGPSSPSSSSSASQLYSCSELDLEDIQGQLFENAIDQYGSRFLQQRISTADEMELETAFKELRPYLRELTTHVFGNYIVQKFFEYGTYEQFSTIMHSFRGRWNKFSLDLYGCRVVQKAIGLLPDVFKAMVVNELLARIVECIVHQNGNHVIQRIIVSVPQKLLTNIVYALSGTMYRLSIHPYGCRVMQRLLENGSQYQIKLILLEVLKNTESLILNEYGNYVIQHVMEYGGESERGVVIGAITGKICPLSQHKFASNVVEKCIMFGSEVDKKKIVAEISQESVLLKMMTNRYGNYVIQKALDIATPEQKQELVVLIHPHLPLMRKYTYGKHIVYKVRGLISRASLTQW